MPRLPRDQHSLLARFTASLPADVRAAPRLLIAVSGGSDSMALLELTALVRGGHARSDLVAYVDHGLRPETGAEAVHVRTAAERLGTAFALVELDVGGRDERRLREARYAELQKLVVAHGLDFVLTGHTRDDQIETVLHRLVRGAGRHGLAGIPQRRGNVVRPLLGFARDELRRFLLSRGIDWREDASNEDLGYLRNRLRHRVIPAFEAALGHGALDHLPALASAWSEEEAYLESEAARYGEFVMTGPSNSRRLDARALLVAPAALRTRIVRAWLAERTGRSVTSFRRAESAAVLALAVSTAGTRRLTLDRLDVVNAYGMLDVTCPGEAADVRSPFRFELATRTDSRVAGPGGWMIEIANLAPATRGPANAEPGGLTRDQRDFDRERLGDTLVVRPGRPGDRLRPSTSGHKKVSDLMIDSRVPYDQRASWPVVEANGHVVWVPGLAQSEDFAAVSATRQCVRLSWRRELA